LERNGLHHRGVHRSRRLRGARLGRARPWLGAPADRHAHRRHHAEPGLLHGRGLGDVPHGGAGRMEPRPVTLAAPGAGRAGAVRRRAALVVGLTLPGLSPTRRLVAVVCCALLCSVEVVLMARLYAPDAPTPPEPPWNLGRRCGPDDHAVRVQRHRREAPAIACYCPSRTVPHNECSRWLGAPVEGGGRHALREI